MMKMLVFRNAGKLLIVVVAIKGLLVAVPAGAAQYLGPLNWGNMVPDEATALAAACTGPRVARVLIAADTLRLYACANGVRSALANVVDVDATGPLAVDNLSMSGNTIISTDTNGNITLDPNGTGKVTIPTANKFDVNTIEHAGPVDINATGVGNSVSVSGDGINLDGGSIGLQMGGSGTALNYYNGDLLPGTSAQFGLPLLAAPPVACTAPIEGQMYADTSHAACFCDGSTWQKLTGSGAGTCA
jgi:hypothetical protein